MRCVYVCVSLCVSEFACMIGVVSVFMHVCVSTWCVCVCVCVCVCECGHTQQHLHTLKHTRPIKY